LDKSLTKAFRYSRLPSRDGSTAGKAGYAGATSGEALFVLDGDRWVLITGEIIGDSILTNIAASIKEWSVN
jgi:hypothetical protein